MTCECDGDTLPGALWPWGTGSDTSEPWVERCDQCERFPDDYAAAYALAAHVNGIVIFHQLQGGWSPAVYKINHPALTRAGFA
jgi:hypothetical protein